MTSKIEVPRELAEEILKVLKLDDWQQAGPLAELLAAPEAPRQLCDCNQGRLPCACKLAPLSPDHSGGGAGVVLPSDKEIRELKIKAAWQADLTSGASYYTAAEFAADAMLDKVKELNQ